MTATGADADPNLLLERLSDSLARLEAGLGRLEAGLLAAAPQARDAMIATTTARDVMVRAAFDAEPDPEVRAGWVAAGAAGLLDLLGVPAIEGAWQHAATPPAGGVEQRTS